MEKRWESATENKALEKGGEISWRRFSSFWNNHLRVLVRETTSAEIIRSTDTTGKTLISILLPESLPLSCNFVIWGNKKLLPLTSIEHQRCKSTIFLESLGYSWLPCPPLTLLDLLSCLQPAECHRYQAPGTKHLWLFVYVWKRGTWGWSCEEHSRLLSQDKAAAMKGLQGHFFLSFYSYSKQFVQRTRGAVWHQELCNICKQSRLI